jgi:hypothetical protein
MCTWRKSNYSGNNGDACVETAAGPGAVLVRNSKDTGGPVLAFASGAWAAFAAQVKVRPVSA